MHTQKIRSKLKSTTAACPVLGLVPAGAWVGRPPVLGLVALRGVLAPSAPWAGAYKTPYTRRALFVMTEPPVLHPTTSGAGVAEGEWGSLRRGTPLTLPICPASSQARDRVASNVEHVLVFR